MKFSRAKMQHLKWLRRKELIRINCFIIVAILVMVLLFMGFPIVSNASDLGTLTDIPSTYTPLSTQFPDLSFDNSLTVEDFDYLYPDSDINDFWNCLYDSEDIPEWLSEDYFDGDPENGELYIDTSALSQTLNCYLPVTNSSGRITNYTLTGTTSVPTNNLVLGVNLTNNTTPVLTGFNNSEGHLYSSKGSVSVDVPYIYLDNTLNGRDPTKELDNSYYTFGVDSFIYNNKTCYVFTSNSSNNISYGSRSFYSNQIPDGNGYNYREALCNFYTGCKPYIYSLSGIDRVYLTEKSNNNGGTSRLVYTDTVDGTTVYYSDIWEHDDYPVYNANGGGDGIPDHKKPYEGSCVYMQYSNLNTGNMHIVVKSDEFQKSQNASIKLKCFVSAQTQYNSSVGLQQSNVGVDGPFQNNFSSPNESFNNGPYVEYEIPLSSFNNSGDYTISLEDINKGLWNSNEKTLYSFNTCFQNNSTGLATAVKTFFFSLLSVTNIIPDYSNMPNFLYSLNSEVWDVQGVFCIGESEEIFDSFQLDMISGNIENQDYALPNEDDIKDALNTPTVPNNYVPQPYAPKYPDAYNVTVPNSNTDVDNDNSNNNNVNPTNNNDVTNGDYSPSVINNNNVTVTQGNKYPEKGVMNSFLRIINNDKNNTVNDLSTLTGANNYIALMNNALSVVPPEVWQVWLTALKAILGIVVSAFFLKILINWST